MREMKDSGIEWVGEIPKTWNIRRGKFVFKYMQKPVHDDDEVITCFRDGEVTLRSNRREDGFTVSDKEIGYQGIDVGDLIVHGMDGFSGAIGISTSRGKASPVLNVLDTNEYKKYYMYFLRSSAWSGLFISLATGIRVRTCDTNWGKLRDIFYVVPPIKEQIHIATFLDHQCAEIDAIAHDIQAEIDTLEAYKQSIISEAVTKGLDKDAPMKDSAIEWLDRIPAHWKVDNPKWHFEQRKDRAIQGLPQLTASQKYGVILQDEYMERTGTKVVTVQKDFDILKLVCAGDFVIHMRSFQGGLEYSQITGNTSSAYIMLIPGKTILEHNYYKWFFKSPAYIEALSTTSNLIRDGQAMRWANFIQLPILLPPETEQKSIAAYLDAKCTEIDAIITQKQEQLAVLDDYKKSVIYEYVTGKKEAPVA